MKKKIGLLIPNLLHGGAEKVLSEISIILSEKHDVYLILFDGSNISYEYAGELIDMKCISKKSRIGKVINIYNRARTFNKIKKELELDLVISFLRSANLVNYFSNKKGKKIISCRGYSDFKKSHKLYSIMLKKVNGIIFPSKKMSQEFQVLYPSCKDKIFLLYNPLNIKKIDSLKMESIPESVKTFMEGHRTICALGSFKKDKGFWHLLKAFSLLKKEVPNARLIFIGDRGELEKDIKNMAKNSSFKEDILFVGHQKNPYKFLAKSEIFVMSSLNEGFPNALIEAMACNLAIVSSDCNSGPREILQKELLDTDMFNELEKVDYGILVPKFSEVKDFQTDVYDNTHEILSNAIGELIKDETLYNHYKIKASDRSKEYDIENFEKNFYEVVNKVYE